MRLIIDFAAALGPSKRTEGFGGCVDMVHDMAGHEHGLASKSVRGARRKRGRKRMSRCAPAPHLGVAVASDVADEKFCVPMDTDTTYCAASFSSASSTVSMMRPYLLQDAPLHAKSFCCVIVQVMGGTGGALR